MAILFVRVVAVLLARFCVCAARVLALPVPCVAAHDQRQGAGAAAHRQPPPTRQRSGHYHATTLCETLPNWQLPRQIAGSQGNPGRAGAEFSRAAPCLRGRSGSRGGR